MFIIPKRNQSPWVGHQCSDYTESPAEQAEERVNGLKTKHFGVKLRRNKEELQAIFTDSKESGGLLSAGAYN